MQFIQARWFTKSTLDRGIKWIVIHSMEAPEKGETAENVAQYFHRTDTKASAHYCIDNNSIVQCVLDKDVAYAAPNANRHGLHFEHAGYAKQTAAEWDDEYSRAMLKLSAELVAEKCKLYGIPAVWRSPDELKQGLRGITSHANCTKAFGGSHTDPGAGFPHAEYVAAVAAILSPASEQRTINPSLWTGSVRPAFWALYSCGLPPEAKAKLEALRDDPYFPPRT